MRSRTFQTSRLTSGFGGLIGSVIVAIPVPFGDMLSPVSGSFFRRSDATHLIR